MARKLPKGWKRIALGDVCEVNPRADALNGVDRISFVAMADTSESGQLMSQAVMPVTKKALAGYTRFRRGDILCAKITPCFENGKGALTDSLEMPHGIGSTEFHVIRASDRILPEIAHAVVQSTEFRRRGELWMTGSAGQKRVPADYIAEYEMELPPLDEQRRIVRVVDAADRLGELQKHLLLEKNQVLDGLREHLLRKPRKARQVRLEKLTVESVSRNRHALERNSIMAVTKEAGLRPMRAETIAADISRYKMVGPDAFAYNPMRLNIGSIARSGFDDDVLVSPDYVVFECDKQRLLPAYLDHLRRTKRWESFFARAGDGGVRVRIYYDDLARFVVELPTVDEQKRVVQALDAMQREVELLKQICVAAEKLKSGLMQQLLTGQQRLTRDLPGMESSHV